MSPKTEKIVRICAREGCNHLQASHYAESGQTWPSGPCHEDDCSCWTFIHPISILNKDFPGANQKIILGRQSPPTDLGTNQDLLLASCIKTIMRLCKHINVMPDKEVAKAWMAIKETEKEMSESCSHCRLQWGQGGSHLYGCEVGKKIEAKIETKRKKEQEEKAIKDAEYQKRREQRAREREARDE